MYVRVHLRGRKHRFLCVRVFGGGSVIRDPDFLTPEEYDKKYWTHQIEDAKSARQEKIARGEEPDLLE